MAVKNKVQLITYPDSLGGDLKELKQVLDSYLPDLFQGGLHILPPFVSSGDRGFAPITYMEIEPRFGDWKDIKALTDEYDVMLDLMANHISRKSVYFQDFLEHGFESPYADLFITLDKVWENGRIDKDDFDKIFLRRPEPFSTYQIKTSGEPIKIWTTFGKTDPSEQIDLDIKADSTKNLFIEFLSHFNKYGIKMVRLDAVGFIVKKAGTSCFFVEPEIFDFLSWMSHAANKFGIDLLPEIHAHHSVQEKLSNHGYNTYDFILPYLVLEAFVCKTTHKLAGHLAACPKNQFTMLDCHDGIPLIPDLNDIVSIDDARKVVDVCLSQGGNLSKIFADKYKGQGGFDVHQIRSTYYSAMGCDDDAYLAARAIQLFTPGIPQVYYVGLLAGENDADAVRLGEGRDINRHNFTLDEIEISIQKDVVKRLLKLIRFRNSYDAFDGDFWVEEFDDLHLRLGWKKENNTCILSVDIDKGKFKISFIDEDGISKKLHI